jgi:hypothetical protein
MDINIFWKEGIVAVRIKFLSNFHNLRISGGGRPVLY